MSQQVFTSNGTLTGRGGWGSNPRQPNQVMTGEDIAEIIDSEGGSGVWEDDSEDEATERWLFPRFEGAEDIGTCTYDEDEADPIHIYSHTRQSICVDFEPDPSNMYLSRAGISGHDSDVETLVDWLAAPRGIVGAINLEGPPGGGKTILLEAAATHALRPADQGILPHLCTGDDTRETLLLRFVGEGKGECLTHSAADESGQHHAPGLPIDETCVLSPYTYGSLAYAAIHGMIWYGDEWMMLQDTVKVILYSATDGRPFLPGGSIDGRDLRFHPNFRVVLSSNPSVRGASMPEPMASRTAGTTLTVETSGAMLRDLAIDDSIVSAWEALGVQGLFRPQIREMRVADYWLTKGEQSPKDSAGNNQYLTQAASAMIPGHCPESERPQVRDIVVSFIGGNLRPDGRLVVS